MPGSTAGETPAATVLPPLAKRLECAGLPALLQRKGMPKNGTKLRALQTLRGLVLLHVVLVMY
jgi:hypothetical protein